MSRALSDQVALARDNPDRPAWYGKMAPAALPALGRRLLSAHVTIASSWKVLWWITK